MIYSLQLYNLRYMFCFDSIHVCIPQDRSLPTHPCALRIVQMYMHFPRTNALLFMYVVLSLKVYA